MHAYSASYKDIYRHIVNGANTLFGTGMISSRQARCLARLAPRRTCISVTVRARQHLSLHSLRISSMEEAKAGYMCCHSEALMLKARQGGLRRYCRACIYIASSARASRPAYSYVASVIESSTQSVNSPRRLSCHASVSRLQSREDRARFDGIPQASAVDFLSGCL